MSSKNYKFEIVGGNRHTSLNLKEAWEYRDLIILFVKRDFSSLYKQTVLGPVWFFVQPVLTSLIYTLIFNNAIKIPMGDVPPMMFYLTGLTLFMYFRDVFIQTSNTFVANAGIYGKVYFPRIVLPISYALSSLLKLLLMFVAILGFGIYYNIQGSLVFDISLLMIPVYILIMAFLGLGLGMILASMIAKYRDFRHMLEFASQILMWGSFVVINLKANVVSGVMNPKLVDYLFWNPLVPVLEGFKYGVIGDGYLRWDFIGYSAAFAVISLVLGLFIFNNREKDFVDTV
jgi:lipopolysaccharide transport system permease protein